jgi:hypothetical protein
MQGVRRHRSVPPTAPSSLTATADAQSYQIALSWSNGSNNCQNILIERSTTTDGSFVQIKSVPYPATSYTDTTVSGGTTYWYRARAQNTPGGYSGYPKEASATTLPSVSTNLGATANAFNTAPAITLSWTNTSSASYVSIMRMTGTTGSYTPLPGTVPVIATTHQTYQDTAVAPGTTYSYEISACNGTGCSAESNSASATTPIATPVLVSIIQSLLN